MKIKLVTRIIYLQGH